jgi:hypothetical protein
MPSTYPAHLMLLGSIVLVVFSEEYKLRNSSLWNFLVIRWLINMEQLVEWDLAGETEVLERNRPQRNFVLHKPHMGSNPGRLSVNLASNRLPYFTAQNSVHNKPFVWSCSRIRVRRKRSENCGSYTGDLEYDWVLTPCSALQVQRRLKLRSVCHLLLTYFFHGLLFNPDVGGGMFFRNVSGLPANHVMLQLS